MAVSSSSTAYRRGLLLTLPLPALDDLHSTAFLQRVKSYLVAYQASIGACFYRKPCHLPLLLSSAFRAARRMANGALLCMILSTLTRRGVRKRLAMYSLLSMAVTPMWMGYQVRLNKLLKSVADFLLSLCRSILNCQSGALPSKPFS